MIDMATSLGRSGLQDWLIQRVTAVILAIYMGILIFHFIVQPDLTYPAWRGLFENTWMRYWSLLALLSLIAHAWIGVWTVSTDYVKPLWLRFPLQIIIIVALLGYLVWGVQIIWAIQ